MSSERDRETIEKAKQKQADFNIVKGLSAKGYSDSEIAKMMGAPEFYIRTIIRRIKIRKEVK